VALSREYRVRLIYCFEKNGVLSDLNDNSAVIRQINADNCARLKADGTISAGMLPKVDNAFAALNAGVSEVVITSFRDLNNDRGTSILPTTNGI
jgi:acetylglutamate kinase